MIQVSRKNNRSIETTEIRACHVRQGRTTAPGGPFQTKRLPSPRTVTAVAPIAAVTPAPTVMAVVPIASMPHVLRLACGLALHGGCSAGNGSRAGGCNSKRAKGNSSGNYELLHEV